MDTVALRSNQASNANSSKPKIGGGDNLAQAQNLQVQDGDGDKDNSVGQSNVRISADALQLASTSVTPAVSNQTQIPNQEKANEVVAKVVKDIQNNPGQAKTALSAVSSGNVGRLLAENLLSA